MPKEQGDKPRNSTRNQMEQNATRVGRQARQHYPEPDDDGTECQKTRETSPENQKEPENDDGTKMVSWKN